MDAVHAHEIGDSGEKNHQQNDDHRESAPRGSNNWFAEGFHAVADGFNAGHRGAAAGKCLQNDPGAGNGRGLRDLGKRFDGDRMPAGNERPEQTDEDGREQRPYK